MKTQTPKQSRPAPRVQRPDTDLVPKNLRWLRVLLTVVAAVNMFVGVGGAAFARGHHSSYLLPLGGFVAGVILFVAANRPRLYLALADRRANRRLRRKPVSDPAAQADQPSYYARQPVQALPAAEVVEPDESLPYDFRYIVGGARRMTDKLRASLASTYDTLIDEDERYRGAVILVRSIAQEWKKDGVKYAEPADEGFADPRNPGRFLVELDDIAGSVAAVAAVMLVRPDPDVSEAVWNTVMEPWFEAHIPFSFDGVLYKTDDAGNINKFVPKPRTSRTKPGGDLPLAYAPPTQRGREQVDLDLTDTKAAVTPPAARPAPSRAAAQQPAPAAPRPTAKPAPAPAPAASATGPTSPLAAASPVGSPYTVADLAMAAELVLTSQLGSLPMIQRKMRIGFATAGAIMDRLAAHGLVRPTGVGGAWDVLEPASLAADIAGWIEKNEETRQ